MRRNSDRQLLPAVLPTTTRGVTRRDIFLEVAGRLFSERGYHDVSVNDIVAEAGGSLATLYRFFPEKKDLLRALGKDSMEHADLHQLKATNDQLPVKESLNRAAQELRRVTLTPAALAMYRATIGAQGEFAEEWSIVMETRREVHTKTVSAYFHRQTALGVMAIASPNQAAIQFLALTAGLWLIPVLYGSSEFSDPGSIDAAIESSVDAFLRAYPLV